MESNKNLDENISTYHHPIHTSYKITSHTSIYNIYTDIIKNSDFRVSGCNEALSQVCVKIKKIQAHMNGMEKKDPAYKKYKDAKNSLKANLGGCYYQTYKAFDKVESEDDFFTGYMVIDIDHYSQNYQELKVTLETIPEVVMYFTSPSGGLKIIVCTDLQYKIDRDVYQQCYQMFIDYLKDSYQLVIDFDPSAKSNYNLICFYGYDEDAYFNDEFTTFECYDTALIEIENTRLAEEANANAKTIKNNGIEFKNYNESDGPELSEEELEHLISKALEGYNKEDPGDTYECWRDFNFGLCDLLKDDYVDRAVSIYGEDESDKILGFDKDYGSNRTSKITKATIYHYAKIAGYKIKGRDHPYSNVIALEPYQRAQLVKDNLSRWDITHPAPTNIYPNIYTETKFNRDGTEEVEIKHYKDNDNIYALMTYLGINLSYDVIKGIKLGTIPFYRVYNGANDEEILHHDLEDILVKNTFPKEKVNHLLRLHHSNRINPLVDMCRSNEWDGIDRISQIESCLQVFDGYHAWLSIALRKWLIQCCAAWDNASSTPNTKARPVFDNVLIFTGSQGINKSSFFEGLLPKELQGYFAGGKHLDPENTDSIRQCTTYGIVELGEIDTTFKKRDISQLKAFLSNSYDQYREAYARKDTKKERRTSYCGTVNGMSFLRDLTGNRRYYPIAIHDIDFEQFAEIDKTQLWLQVCGLYMDGETWWLDKNSKESCVHKTILEEHMEIDPILNKLHELFDLSYVNEYQIGEKYTTRQVLEVIDVLKSDDQRSSRHVNQLLEGMGFIAKRSNRGKEWCLVSKIVGRDQTGKMFIKDRPSITLVEN